MSATLTARYETRRLRSGQIAVVDTENRNRVALIGTAEEAEEFLSDYWSYMNTCECELDWNCHLHRGGYTALERQNDAWASRDSDDERYLW